MGSTADGDAGGGAVFLGVDTHLDAHAAVVLDGLGRRLGSASFPATTAGYASLLGWAEGMGPVETAGVEGTGCYGAGLARFLGARGLRVLEVGRPKRRDRRGPGKSDPIDAELAARAVLAGTASGEAKGADGRVEAIRALRAARRSAVKARSQAANQLKSLLVTAPDRLRDRLRGLATAGLVEAAARLRPGPRPSDPEEATKLALRSVARRHLALSEEISELDAHLGRLVSEAAPELLEVHGVGVETAAALLVAAGDNPERLRSEASFAHLCGTAPIPASSGKTVRHRLNRQGNRDNLTDPRHSTAASAREATSKAAPAAPPHAAPNSAMKSAPVAEPSAAARFPGPAGPPSRVGAMPGTLARPGRRPRHEPTGAGARRGWQGVGPSYPSMPLADGRPPAPRTARRPAGPPRSG